MKTKIYKYSREEILKELNRFQCIGFTNADPVHGLVARYKVNGDFNLDSVIKPMLLAKSTPKKKSKEINFEEIEEVEEYFNRGELSTTINLLIRNQKKLQDTINLLIKNK